MYRSIGQRTAITVLAVLAAYLLRLLLIPVFNGHAAYGPFLVVNFLIAWFYGLRYALLSSALGFFGGMYFLQNYSIMTGAELLKAQNAYGANYVMLSAFLVYTTTYLIRTRSNEERLRRELQESNERYEAFVQNSTEGIWCFEIDPPLDTDRAVEEQIAAIFSGRVYLAQCNDAMARMYSVTRKEDFIGARLETLLSPDDPRNVEYIRQLVLSGYRLSEYESFEEDKEGHPKVFLNSLVGHRNSAGQIVRAWGTQTDITERKRFEKEREGLLESERKARTSAEEASRAKLLFLATLSHELRTPMNAIMVCAHMLNAGQVKLEKAIGIIVRNSAALMRIVDDLLDTSSIINGKLQIRPEPVSPGEIMAAALDTVRHGIEQKGLKLRLEVDPSVPVVLCDRDRLQQIFWNLLSNALKFTRTGWIIVRVRSEGPWVEIQVEDTGDGIPPEFMRHLFERFSQGSPGPGRDVMGLGLGLSITKHLVEVQGGEISAESDGLGRGALFTVRFPVYVRPAEDGLTHQEDKAV
jgi:signal transduction histidine kinase